MSEILFLIDWRSADEFSISQFLADTGRPVKTICMANVSAKDYKYKWRYPILLFKYLQLALKAILIAKKDDTIISWNFTIGFCCSLIRFFSFTKPKLICLNIIAHESKGLVGLVRKKLYSFFLNKEGIYITANSSNLFKQFNAEFDIPYEKMFVLEDPILSVYEKREYVGNQSYIFCGGVAKRDWETFFKASELLPEHKFVGVASKNGFPDNLKIPSNVVMYFDITLEEFNNLLKGATIQVLPLTSLRPAGLIGMITGALLSVPIITTQTPSMENYIDDGSSGILVQLGDHVTMASAIKLLYNDKELQKKQVLELQKFIEANYSEEAYSRKLDAILTKTEIKFNKLVSY